MKTRQTILCGGGKDAAVTNTNWSLQSKLRRSKSFWMMILILPVLTFIACDNGTGSGGGPGTGPGTGSGTTVPGSTLAEKLAWVRNANNVQSGKTYIIEVNADESIGQQTFDYGNSAKFNITIILKGIGQERVISLSSNGILFYMRFTTTLVLDNNITLQGRNGNPNSLVYIENLGKLEMKAGSKITGNNTSNNSSGGVYNGGTFTMNGGEISGNSANNNGGGVLTFGTFTMNGGKISGNSANNNGGGVYNEGTFTMNGGEISGNSANNGGGVYMNGGTFRIVTGTVYGSSEGALSNTATTGAALNVANSGMVQHGTFSGTTWNSAGTLNTNNNTINVVNGVLQP